MKRDETFIGIFLQFMNDKTADARAAEVRFMDHPYVKNGIKRGFPFQQSFDVSDYRPLQTDMARVLNRVRRGTNSAQRKEIVEKLNSLALKIPLKDKVSGQDLLDDKGNPLAWPILATAKFELDRRVIEIGAEPIVNGMEFACWYSALLISRRSGKIKRCKLQECNRWFNAIATRTLGYCSVIHSREAERINSAKRAWNARNPDRPKKISISTAPKRRSKPR